MGLLDLLNSFKKFKKDPNIIILGLDNSGKTTLLHNLSQEKVSKTEPTKGVNIKTIIQPGFSLNVWDIGGQEEIRQYWEAYYSSCDALIFVVDGSDDLRLPETRAEFEKILNEKKLEGVPILVLVNKNDLPTCLGPDEIIEKMNMDYITGRDWSLYACSALKGTGINEGIKWLLGKVAEKENA